MNTKICRVVSQTEPSFVTTQKGEQLAKCYVRVKEVGGDFTDEYVCVVLGNLAQVKFEPGDVVIVTMRFRLFENNGNYYQDVTATEILKMNN